MVEHTIKKIEKCLIKNLKNIGRKIGIYQRKELEADRGTKKKENGLKNDMQPTRYLNIYVV